VETVDVRRLERSFVIRFGCEGSRINAYTLATTLVAISDAAKAANSTLNPGYEIEILVEGVGDGSFKAQIRAVYHAAKNLFSKQTAREIVIAIIAAYIYEHTLGQRPDVKVIVETDEVVITQGDTRVVIPRDVHDSMQQAIRVPEFGSGVSRAFEALQNDPAITDMSLWPQMHEARPPPPIPRNDFQLLSRAAVLDQGDKREIVETTELQITRAILERGRKRWQFVWRGVRISAPVLDDLFYDRFFAHDVTIAPGDVLRVRLRVRQSRDPDTGIYLNDINGYEVEEVLEHRPKARQIRGDFASGKNEG